MGNDSVFVDLKATVGERSAVGRIGNNKSLLRSQRFRLVSTVLPAKFNNCSCFRQLVILQIVTLHHQVFRC